MFPIKKLRSYDTNASIGFVDHSSLFIKIVDIKSSMFHLQRCLLVVGVGDFLVYSFFIPIHKGKNAVLFNIYHLNTR